MGCRRASCGQEVFSAHIAMETVAACALQGWHDKGAIMLKSTEGHTIHSVNSIGIFYFLKTSTTICQILGGCQIVTSTLCIHMPVDHIVVYQ